MKQVPILQIPFDGEDRRFLKEGIEDILDSGFLTLGKWTSRFEDEFASLVGSRYCTAVNSGTAALEVILRALDVCGASVIVPTNTFLATALAVVHAGNRVIFADSDPYTLSLDVSDVERRIAADTKAVILVHIGGIVTPAWRDLRKLCDERGLYLIEDCAHAHGCAFDGLNAGTLGIAGAFSFFPTKVMTTGEGGAIVTDDPEVFRRSSMLRNQGKDPAMGSRISALGHNFRMSEFTALAGVGQTRKIDSLLEQRRRIARFYDRALRDLDGIRPVRPFGPSGYYKYVAYLDSGIDRAHVKARMKSEHRVSLAGEVYADLCHTEPVWDSFTYCGRRRDGSYNGCIHSSGSDCTEPQRDFPGATRISERHICLPLYPGLTEQQLAHVVSSLVSTIAGIG